MEILFLGTAAAEGCPSMFCVCPNCKRIRQAGGKNIRTRSQALVDGCLLMDFGPDTFYHATTQEVDFTGIHSVLLTHSHTDHLYTGDILMRPYPYASGTDGKVMTVYGNEKCAGRYERAVREDNDAPDLERCVAFGTIRAGVAFHIPGYRVLPLKAAHDPEEECLIYVVESRDGERLLYANDTARLPEAAWETLQGMRLDLVSLDCTMGIQEDSSGHMGLASCRETRHSMVERGIADSDTRFVITHFSHNGGLLHHELEEAVRGDGILVAYDGMRIAL